MQRNQVSPEVVETLQAIEDAYDVIQAEMPDSERLRRPTPKLQDAVIETGVFKSLMPRRFGGAGASCTEHFQIIEKLSYASSSLGWIARVIASSTAFVACGLKDEVAQELFAGPKCALVVGEAGERYTTPALRVEGGYQVTAEGQFIPGLSMADYVYLGVDVGGEQRILVIPRSALYLTDNWEMLGLRASGTLDWACQDLFVPDDYSFKVGDTSDREVSLANSLPPATAATLNQTAWSQGVGKRLLAELNRITQHSRKDAATNVTSAEFYAEYARHYSHTRGTGALAENLWEDVDAALDSGEQPDMELQTMVRLGASLATRTVLEICQLTHRFAGGHIMREGTVQRLFRDGHAGTQHRGTAHFVTQACGEFLTGSRGENVRWGPDGLEEVED